MTFFLFGKYTGDGMKGIAGKRTERAAQVFAKRGGALKSAHALLGDRDLVIVADLPTVNEALQASVELGRITGIRFNTSPAITVDEFDKLVEGL